MTKHMSELVSVIIPVYNSAQFLNESIESVINQTYSNIEIICINDGSTDNSLEILKQYSDKITIISQENHGLASALNAGIKQMMGSWFKWFSPDDVMYPNAIETLVNVARKNCDTIVYSNWQIIDEKGNKLREFHESNYNKLSNFEYNVRLLDGQQINVNTALIPSSLLEKCNFRELDDPVAIDYDFFLYSALLCEINFYLISKSLIKYRIHTNQLSHKNISKSINYTSRIKNDILMQFNIPTREKYTNALQQYQKIKPTKRKITEFGMKLLTSIPSCMSDRIFIFYLNKIRHNR
jgi:glycosyltransferase involved in cell wall biosynthesis